MCCQITCKIEQNDYEMIKLLKRNMSEFVNEKMVPYIGQIHYISCILNPLTKNTVFCWDTNGEKRNKAFLLLQSNYIELHAKLSNNNNDNNNNNNNNTSKY